ncbi:MAG: hypothetical protein Q4G26_03100 [Paracoccus sp. (in: a-proteobacteria)]|nr:hypothetical protein [Paracoccus sp. (in: a-proteobacteria)]
MLPEVSARGCRRPVLALAVLALGSLPLSGAPQDGPKQFRSPSGNIGCIAYGPGPSMDEHQLRCDLSKYSPVWTDPPEDCDLDWGGVLFLGDEGAALRGCVGDVGATPDAPVLPYGQTFRAGKMLCKMERSGLTCINATGHGFFMSYATQRLF